MRASALVSRMQRAVALQAHVHSRFACSLALPVMAAHRRAVHAGAGVGAPSPRGPGDLPHGPETAIPGLKGERNPGGPHGTAISNPAPGAAGTAVTSTRAYAAGEAGETDTRPSEQLDGSSTTATGCQGGPDDPHAPRGPIVMALSITPADPLPKRSALAHAASHVLPRSHVVAHSLTPQPDRVPQGLGFTSSGHDAQHEGREGTGGAGSREVGDQPERFHPGCDGSSFTPSGVDPAFHRVPASTITSNTSPAGYAHELDTGCLDEAAAGGGDAASHVSGSDAVLDEAAPRGEVDVDVVSKRSATASAGPAATRHRAATPHDAVDVGEPLPGRAMQGGSAEGHESAASAHVRSPLRHVQHGGGPQHPPDTRVE